MEGDRPQNITGVCMVASIAFWHRDEPNKSQSWRRAATSLGLVDFTKHVPRVARCSQPWALRRNPFGIERAWNAQEEWRRSLLLGLMALLAILFMAGCAAPGPKMPS